MSVAILDILDIDSLPVEGTHKDDFVSKNKWVRKVRSFKALDKGLDKYREETKDIFSRVMWLIVYTNYSGFLQDSFNYMRKEELIRDAFNVPKPILSLKIYKEANGDYRKFTLPRPLRVLLAVERQIDNATNVMENQRASTVDEIKKINEFMKNFGDLKGRWKEAKEDWDDASRTVGMRERNGNLLSAVESGDLFVD